MYSSILQVRAAAELELRRRKQAPVNLWAEYADPDPIRFIQTHFYIPETNQPMQLYPSQENPLREALTIEPDGNFRYSTVVWSAIKKSAKSSIAAAVGLWFAWRKPWSSIKVIANDLKQADSRVAYYMRRAIELHPKWRNEVKIINYKITFPNHSFIEAIPIDPTGEAGGNDDLIIFSELWGWKNAAAQKMWTEMTLSPMKYGQSLRFCETYAGFNAESPVLENLYDNGVKNGEVISEEFETYRKDKLFVLWNTKPSLPWQTEDYYRSEAANLLETEFNRIHKNQWGDSTEAFVPSEWLDACIHPLPPYEKLESWVIALDAAISGDCFGLVAVTRINGITVVRHVKKWTPPINGKIMFNAPIGTPLEQDESPAGELRRLEKRHSIVKVCFDPYQLFSFCNQLKEELVVFFDEFPQNTKRLLADKSLRDMIRERKLWYDGNPDLRDHILNANAKSEGESDKLRLVKRSEKGKIDLAVCLSMAAYEAERMNIG